MTGVAAGLWQPRSGCGPACLPDPGDRAAAVPAGRRIGRLAALVAVLVVAALLAPALPVLPRPVRQAAVQRLAGAVLRALGVRLAVRGGLRDRPALLVANHVSWLDAVVVLAVAPARMLAKREVRRWPLVGVLAAAAGTLFVDRRRPRSLPASVAEVRAVLGSGGTVAVFPEGTTYCGEARGGYRPAMFQAAMDAGVPVVPLTLAYRDGRSGALTTAPAFVGADTLWRSLRRVLAVPALVATVTVSPALHPAPGATRRALARAAESTVRLLPPPVRPVHFDLAA